MSSEEEILLEKEKKCRNRRALVLEVLKEHNKSLSNKEIRNQAFKKVYGEFYSSKYSHYLHYHGIPVHDTVMRITHDLYNEGKVIREGSGSPHSPYKYKLRENRVDKDE